MDSYALITGASKGIGKQIAIILAARKYNLLLVARSDNELNVLKSYISEKYQVGVETLTLDLSTLGAASYVAEWCSRFPVSVLVNNAGYGLRGDFSDVPIDQQLNMLQLNINAVVELSHYMLPVLKGQDQSYILNIASTAAYQALPTLSVYAASKAFILSFSRALRFELANSNVSVTCVSPGPVDTGFAERAGLNALSKMAQKFNMKPEVVAEIAVRGMLKGKAEVIPGFTNLISAYANRILPKAVIEKAAAGIYKTIQ